MSSPRTQTPKSDGLKAVAEAIREHDRFLLATHENPDGDALGSLLATKLVLDELGKESVMYLSGEAPLPAEYKFMALEALRLAAELMEAGADVHRVFQSVYESVQLAKLKLLARALERAQVYEGGGIVVSYLRKTDFAEVGAAEPYSEGIIDFLRAVEGAEMAALIREPPAPGRPARRVSLRSSSDELDVSAIARASGDGGGHRQGPRFFSELEIPRIVEFLRKQYTEARAAARA